MLPRAGALSVRSQNDATDQSPRKLAKAWAHRTIIAPRVAVRMKKNAAAIACRLFQFAARCWNIGCVPPSRPVRIGTVDVPRRFLRVHKEADSEPISGQPVRILSRQKPPTSGKLAGLVERPYPTRVLVHESSDLQNRHVQEPLCVTPSQSRTA